MTANSQSTILNTSNNIYTLDELVNTAKTVTPDHNPNSNSSHKQTQKQTLNALLDNSKLHSVNTVPFSGFVLDSRALVNLSVNLSNSSSSSEPLTASVDIKPAFVLLKSHSQPIEKSQQYAKSASQYAPFIISEIDAESLDYQPNDPDYDCPIIFLTNIRDVLGTLIQLSKLDSDVLSTIKSAKDIESCLPRVIAITGTNGKTTVSQLVAQLCQFSDKPGLCDSAVMGTAGNGRLNHLIQASHTTGDVLAVQNFLNQMSNEGVDIIALEASSHGLDQQRLQGVPVSIAIYTNLSRDHLDYHPDMQDYARAKARLFDINHFPQLTHAIINADDEFAPLMIQTAAKSGLKIWLYTLDNDFDSESLIDDSFDAHNGASNVSINIDAVFVAKKIKPSLDGVEIEVASKFGNIVVNSPLLGHFNVSNLLAAIAGGLALGIDINTFPDLVRHLQGASGRMQRVVADSVNTDGVFIVDYAHTPDALTQVLTSLKPNCTGNLWAVFGCGGDRDRGKRPLMAQAGLSVADNVVLTSDNPRSEDPEQILDDMQQGMTDAQNFKTTVIVDRREAIKYAVNQAGSKDIVVIAGKGHETYQEINGVRYDFDDREVLKEALKQKNN